MQYKTTFKTIPLADIVECPYNPRVAIERTRRSMTPCAAAWSSMRWWSPWW